MLLVMSDQFPDQRRDFRERLATDAEREQQEIQDFLNANGALIFGAILVILAVFFVARLVTS